MKKAKALMVVGTSSFAGKTLLVAALCRLFRNNGYRVTPFKAQNMSLNSMVTVGGKEISRSQWLQATAAGIEATEEMNPILLKPKGNAVSQVILNGSPFGDISAGDYYSSFIREKGASEVKKAFDSLAEEYDIIVMEGAGSPAEINLYHNDIANFGSADMAEADVVLVADIERGGVFASIYGTLNLLKPEHKKRVKGIIINKFRGDERLLEPGIRQIQELVGVRVIGVMPFIEDLRLPEEDSQALSLTKSEKADIAVIKLPKISNFTDLDPLTFDPRVSIRYVTTPDELGSPDAIIIPGTKSTIDDLNWIYEKGFEALRDFKGKIPVVGICGGYQILGKRIIDTGVEKGEPADYQGLGFLDVETTYDSYEKTTKKVEGKVKADEGVFSGIKGTNVTGYEIHMGKTKLLKGAQPIFKIGKRDEGAADPGFMTFGTYIHGLFDSPSFRESFINFILENPKKEEGLTGVDITNVWEQNISKIADVVDRCVDLSWFYGK
jgi:adenosylcobyric acid synthase